ncbi:KH domain-containing, RNA-binding, signal transduction-associated protein 3 [Chelonia mydas]|uniref:KH domain-containing, RNA-binding, signal transduction-associated protein 3 n=1 Tax=Chelonia mydas TaxID=8469 RepID=M7B2H5_CHEMY|nr:KH domain-containing, RNA-binding, signal transduction-associated protein 3 [Chelonia mydas]
MEKVLFATEVQLLCQWLHFCDKALGNFSPPSFTPLEQLKTCQTLNHKSKEMKRGRGGVPPPPAGVPRGAPAPRGVPPSRGPVSRGRGLLAPRARGVPPPAGYRPLPPPPAQETYGEYEYDDGYGTAYDEQGYDSYDNSYSTQAQRISVADRG